MDVPERLRGGRYAPHALLGEGAQGVTYDAADLQNGRAVAIKRFDVRGARGWKDVELAEREARVLSTLDHPLVPTYIEHFEEEGSLYLVMEKVEGETMEAMRQRDGTLSEAEVRRFLASADSALTYLHGRASPVVHRDIKPRNVVRRPDGSYVLVDFGAVAELLLRKGASTVVGTMGYMAPEQFQGRAQASTDVYAVGATALAALTGQEPETLPHDGLRVDVRGALGDRVSPDLVAALEKMLDPDPRTRAKSIGEALHAAGRAPSLAPPPTSLVVMDRSAEDAAVKSLRRLMWTMWGLGWVLVPLLLRPFGLHAQIPLVMFGSLAAILFVTWQKGAVLRATLRRMPGLIETFGGAQARSSLRPELGQRVRVDARDGRVRVASGSTARHHDEYADTDIATTREEPKKKRRAR
jgi:hypothetical protein